MKENLNVDIRLTGEVQAKSALDNLTEAERERQNTFKKTNEVFSQHIGQINQSATGFGRLNGIVKNAGKAMLAFFAVQQFSQMASEIIEVTKRFEGFENAIKFASGSAKEGNANLDFLRKTAQKLGLDLESSIKGFKTLQASAKSAGVSTSETRDVFESVSIAVSAMNLSAEDAEGVFLALGQILSKGTVQSEELRGQIGERLPGAFNIAAQAMGVTTRELNKMLEQGQVISTDFLPKFARELRNNFSGALDQSTNSLQANTNRLKNSFTELQLAIGNQFKGALSVASGGLASFVDGLKNVISPAKTVEQQIIAEQQELNSLVLQITSVNNNNQERAGLINKLNAEYPFFLKNLDSETVSNSELVVQLEKVNSAYINRVRIAREQAKIDKVAEVGANASENIEKATEGITRQIAQARQLGAISADRYKQILSDEELLVKAVRTRQLVERDASKLQTQLANARRNVEFSLRERDNTAANRYRAEAAELQKQVNQRVTIVQALKQEEALYVANKDKLGEVNNVLGGFQKKITELQGGIGDVFDAPAEASTQATQIAVDNSKKLLDVEVSRIQAQISLNNQLLEDETLTYQQRIDLINKGFQLEVQLANLRRNQNQDFVAGNIERQASLLKAERARLEAIKAIGVEEVRQAVSFRDIQKQVATDVEADFNKLQEKRISQLKNSLGRELDAIREKNRKELEEERLKNEQMIAIRDEVTNQSLALFSSLTELQSSNYAFETARLQAEKDSQLEIAGDNAARRAQIEREYEQKEKALRNRQAQSEKFQAVFSILAQNAVNVVRALGTPPTPNFPLAGITGAFGLAQAAIVGAKKVPKFAKGTTFLDDANAPRGTDTILMYGNRGERIVSSSENAQIPKWVSNADLPHLVQLGLQSKKGSSLNPELFKQAIKEGLREIPLQNFSLDENGFERYVVQKGSTTKKLNSNYSY